MVHTMHNRETMQRTLSNMNHDGGVTDKIKGRAHLGTIIPNRIFVGGISPNATEKDLADLFQEYGAVKSVKIVIDSKGISKGFGFVTYESADDANRIKNEGMNHNIRLFEKPLHIGPAVMKFTSMTNNRFNEPHVTPVTPNLYFNNNTPYQFQDGCVYHDGNNFPPTPVNVTLPEQYFPSSPYSLPPTQFQGPALYYPVTSTPSVIVNHPPYTPVSSNNSSYQPHSSTGTEHSSPPPVVAHSKPVISTIPVTNVTDANTSNTPVTNQAPPNSYAIQPTMQYSLMHPTQYYNNSIITTPHSDVYYNMIQGACYPMIVNGQESSYLSYYDINHDAYSNNNGNENVRVELPRGYHLNTPPPAINTAPVDNVVVGRVSPNSNNGNNDSKISTSKNSNRSISNGAGGDYGREVYSPDNSPSATNHMTNEMLHTIKEYEAAYVRQQRHAGPTTYIYPNGSTIQHQGVVYIADQHLPPVIGSNHHYAKNIINEHYVSDHPPKRDQKHHPKKNMVPALKECRPNIPNFPYYDPNVPGHVNRNNLNDLGNAAGGGVVGGRDYNRNYVNGKGNMVNGGGEQKQPPQSRSYSNNGGGGGGGGGNGSNNGSVKLQARIFTNQNQFSNGGGGMSRPQKVNYPYNKGPRQLRSHDQANNTHFYQQQSNGFITYKSSYDGNRKSGGYNNNYGYKRYDRANTPNNENTHVKTPISNDRPYKKCQNPHPSPPAQTCHHTNHKQEHHQSSVEEDVCVNDTVNEVMAVDGNQNLDEKNQQQQQQEAVENESALICAEMENLSIIKEK